MLFRKDMEPCCIYCAYGTAISRTEVACTKRGIVSSGGYCKKFSYDPLKREPARASLLKTAGFTEEDFEP